MHFVYPKLFYCKLNLDLIQGSWWRDVWKQLTSLSVTQYAVWMEIVGFIDRVKENSVDLKYL